MLVRDDPGPHPTFVSWGTRTGPDDAELHVSAHTHGQTIALDVRWDDEVGFFCGKSDDDKGGHNCGRDVCGHPLDIEELTRLKNASDGSAEE